MTPGLGSYAFRWAIGMKDRAPDRPMSALEVLKTAADLGFAVVQYADNLPLHRLAEAELDALARAAVDRRVAIEVGIGGFDRGLAARYVDVARRFKARILRVAFEADHAARSDDALAADLQGLLPAARDAGVKIAVENHFGFPAARLARLVDRIDDEALGVCLDVANSICAGEWPAETVRLLAPRTINLHLKDYVIRPDPYGVGFRIEGAPLGEGRTDIAGVLDALQGRPISVIYEHWLPWPGDAATAAAHELDWAARAAARLARTS